MPFKGGEGVVAETEPIDYVSVHEHWDEQEYFIKYDDQIGTWPDGTPTQGNNPFMDPVLGLPVIPYVYAPRLRAGEFWGDSVVPGLIGPQDEINDDLAHLNEGLADAMHQQPWVRDRIKGSQGLNKNRNEWLNLGTTPPGGKNAPEVGRLQGAQLNDSMTDYVVRDLIMLSREHANMPDIAYGRTDASIRSALTLKYMMWPAINVGLHYRRNNATALKQAAYMALVMAYSKRQFNSSINGVGSLGIDSVTPQMIEAVLLGHKTNYPPMLPDDRAELVQEVMQRVTAALMSPETAIRRLDGSSELEEELNKIDEHRNKMAELEEKAAEDAHARNLEVQTKQAENRAKPGDSGDKSKPKAAGTRPQAEGGRNEGDK